MEVGSPVLASLVVISCFSSTVFILHHMLKIGRCDSSHVRALSVADIFWDAMLFVAVFNISKYFIIVFIYYFNSAYCVLFYAAVLF
jgi:hypothetical protein